LRYNLSHGRVDALGKSLDGAVLRPGERFYGAGELMFKGKDKRLREVMETKKRGYGERFSRV
jgi:hypothetical protein